MQSVKQIVQGVANSHLNSPLELSLKGDTMLNTAHANAVQNTKIRTMQSPNTAAKIRATQNAMQSPKANQNPKGATMQTTTHAVQGTIRANSAQVANPAKNRRKSPVLSLFCAAMLCGFSAAAAEDSVNGKDYNAGADGLTIQAGHSVSLSGGKFTGNTTNKGTITSISGEDTIISNQTRNPSTPIGGLFNENGARIINITTNGIISQLDNKGTIESISGKVWIDTVTNQKGATISSFSNGEFGEIINYGTITNLSGLTMVTERINPTTKVPTSFFRNYGYVESISDVDMSSNRFYNQKKTATEDGGVIKEIKSGNFEVVSNEHIINTISGGTYGKFMNNGDTADTSITPRIDKITGGTFTLFKNNNKASVGEIAGGTFTETKNYNVIENISGGVFTNFTNGSNTSAIANVAEIHKITGGTFNDILYEASGMLQTAGLTNYNKIGEISGTASIDTLINKESATITSIKGGTINTKLHNEQKAVISDISGGKLKLLTNSGTISKISAGTAEISELTNYVFGTITEISGGTIDKLNNSNVINDITGSAYIKVFNNNATGGVEQITDPDTKKTSYTAGIPVGISGGRIDTINYNAGQIDIKDKANVGTLNINTSAAGFVNITGGSVQTLNYTRGTLKAIGANATIGTLNNKTANASFENQGTINKLAGTSIKTLTNSGTIDDIAVSAITNVKNSGKISISGTLTGDITNSGTVSFVMKSADKLGQLNGNFTNESGGKVNVNVSGAKLGAKYTLITGSATGIDDSSLTLTSPNSKYLKASYDSSAKAVSISATENFKDIGSQIGENKAGLAKNILTSDFDIMNSSALSDAESTIKESYIGTPQHIISNFKANSINSTPLGQGLGMAFAPTVSEKEFKPTASADLVRFDNGYMVNSFVNEPKMEFFANPFLGELRGNGVKGSLGGVNLGLGYLDENYALQGSFNYAYATSSQDLATQSTDTTAYMFQVGLLGQLFFAELVEIDINANYLLGKFKMSNIWLADSSLNSSSKFNNHQGNVGVAAGLRFGSEFSIKPFVGLQNYFESQGKYSVLGFESEKYSDYALNGVAGIEGRAKIGDLSFLYARVSGEFNFVESQKELFMVNKELNAELKYANETYKNSVSAGLGAQIFATDSVKLSIEGLYKYHDSGLNYYGGSLGVRVAF